MPEAITPALAEFPPPGPNNAKAITSDTGLKWFIRIISIMMVVGKGLSAQVSLIFISHL